MRYLIIFALLLLLPCSLQIRADEGVWRAVKGRLATRWAADVTPENAHGGRAPATGWASY